MTSLEKTQITGFAQEMAPVLFSARIISIVLLRGSKMLSTRVQIPYI